MTGIFLLSVEDELAFISPLGDEVKIIRFRYVKAQNLMMIELADGSEEMFDCEIDEGIRAVLDKIKAIGVGVVKDDKIVAEYDVPLAVC